MITIKDIAKEAGVSHGTVSNVLNQKGNVSIKKIRLVEEAAQRLGYNINQKAHSLRSGANQTVSIILPCLEETQYAHLYESISASLENKGYETHVYTTNDIPYREETILQEIAKERVSGIIAISCLEDANTYDRLLGIPKEQILFINRDLEHSKRFISFNYEQAGYDISSYVKQKGYQHVGILAGDEHFTNEKAFVAALESRLQHLHLTTAYQSKKEAHRGAFEFFTEDQTNDVIIASSPEHVKAIKNAHMFHSMEPLPEIICLTPSEPTYHHDDTPYFQNYRLLGYKLAQSLFDQITGNRDMDERMIVGCIGFSKATTLTNEDTHTQLTMLTIPSPTTDAIAKLLPHFTKDTGIKVNMEVKSYEELYEIVQDKSKVQNYDIIRLDMAWLPWMGKDLFLSLENLDPRLDSLLQQLPEPLQTHYSLVQGTPYALPLDPSIQMLYYRKDLFNEPKVKRMFYEQYKKQLEIPKDYESFQEIAHFFANDLSIDSSVSYGTGTIIGKPEIISIDFLSRYYAEGGRLVRQDTLQLEQEKAETALHSYMNTIGSAKLFQDSWWDEIVHSFSQGELAMMTVFVNHASRIPLSKVGPLVDSAMIPGQAPILGGGVIGISKQSHKTQDAVRWLEWLNQTFIAEQITLLGGTTANLNVTQNQTIQFMYPWLSNAFDTRFQGIRETTLSNSKGYDVKHVEKLIGHAIQKVIQKEWSIQQSIRQINEDLSHYIQHMHDNDDL